MGERVTLNIDGMEFRVDETKTVLQAALENGIYIPHLCYHPDLEPVGVCRLCVVEIEGTGLTVSCMTPVKEGMVVKTSTPEVNKVRRVALELLIVNHHADCLSCPLDSQCKLQEVANFVGLDEKRFKLLRKPALTQPLDTSNPFFLRDPNRCVLCGICVRTCREVVGLNAIDFSFRGFATRISASLDRPIRESICESCGECVVRCPTASLIPKNYRRPFREVKSVCPYCGVGCSIYLGVRGEEVVSVRGDEESPVNKGSLCVKGRFGFSFINSPDRLKKPLVKKNGKFVEVEWEEALNLVAEKFLHFQGEEFAAVSSARATNEENYLVQKFTRVVMKSNNVDNCARICHSPSVTGLGKALGAGGGTNPLADIEGARTILVIGSNTANAHPVAAMRIRKAVREGANLIVVDPRKTELVRHARIWLPIRPGSDVALLMGMARIIVEEGNHDEDFIRERCENFEEFQKALKDFSLDFVEKVTGVEKKRIIEAARIYSQDKPSLIIYSLGITEHTHGTDNVLGLANLALLTGNIGKPSAGIMPMRGQNNVQGACDMGCAPNVLPGYQKIDDPEVRKKFEKAWGCKLPTHKGLTLVEFFQAALEDKVRAFYIVGMDVVYSVPEAEKVKEALEKAEFVVFQDIFLTESARFADVVLPAASFAEKEGSFTNLERRVQWINRAIPPIGDSRPDWWITCEIARKMGAKGFEFTHPSQILEEIASLAPSYGGMSMRRLKEKGIQWPCYDEKHEGTRVLHEKKFLTPSGKGIFTPLTYRPPAEKPDKKYPLILTTGRPLYLFHLAMTSKVRGLRDLYPEERIWLNPQDSEKLGIKEGDKVRVSSRRGEVMVKAKVTPEVIPGTAFMTFHFYSTPTNVLTTQAFDPIAKTPELKVTAIRVEKVE